MAFLTFVTTCHGSLAQLRKTLPSLARQSDAAVVVVDYGCPDQSGRWVEANFPQVHVVRAAESKSFERARARNLGAAQARTPWICFIDPDMGVADDFCERVKPVLAAGRFYQAEPRSPETYGTSICAAADFERIGGYDEVIEGWGKEDEDFYARLFLASVRYAGFPAEVLRPLNAAERPQSKDQDMKDRWVSESINYVYCRAKIDLMMLQHRQIALDVRQRLYAQVRAAISEARNGDTPMTIALPYMKQDTRACGPLEARIVYTLPRPRGDGGPRSVTGSLIPRPQRRRR